MSQPGKSVEFTYDKALEFLKAYNLALDAGSRHRETFTFEGNVFVVGYAYYLLEHLANAWSDPQFRARRAPDNDGDVS